jgi:hypothetical protein
MEVLDFNWGSWVVSHSFSLHRIIFPTYMERREYGDGGGGGGVGGTGMDINTYNEIIQ